MVQHHPRDGRCCQGGDQDVMSFYFWLGIDAEQYADIEDDGFITVHGL